MPSVEAESTLIFAIGVFRHGIRSPIHFPFPNNTYNDYDKVYPEGETELTKAGKKLMYNVGKAFRLRYDRILGKLFVPDKVKFHSTARDRTIMSMELVAHALYPAHDYQKWDPDQTWHPIPVWVDYGEIDKSIIVLEDKQCPRYSELKTEVTDKLNPTNIENLYKPLSEKTGRKMTSPVDLLLLWDNLFFQDLNGLKLPKWTSEFYPDALRKVNKQVLKTWVAGTPEMHKLTAGTLLHFIKNQLSEKANKTLKPDRSVVLLGAHDVSLLGLLHGIKNTESLEPSPGAMIVFELHEIKNKHIVKAFYFDHVNGDKTFHEIKIPICNDPCTLKEFLSKVESFSHEEWKKKGSS